MKNIIIVVLIGIGVATISGCGTIGGAAIGGALGGPRGAAYGALAGAALIDAPTAIANQQQYVVVQPQQNCYRDQWGRIFCQQPQQQVYYQNPPLVPTYPWQYWYTVPAQPGFIFFFGRDGNHYRHQYKHRQPQRQQHQRHGR